MQESQIDQCHVISRIGLRPQFIGLARLFQVASDNAVVVDSISSLSRSLTRSRNSYAFRVFSVRQVGFTEIVAARAEQAIGHRKIRVETDGPLNQSNGGGIIISFPEGLCSKAVGLQRLERRRSCLFKRRGVFLY